MHETGGRDFLVSFGPLDTDSAAVFEPYLGLVIDREEESDGIDDRVVG